VIEYITEEEHESNRLLFGTYDDDERSNLYVCHPDGSASFSFMGSTKDDTSTYLRFVSVKCPSFEIAKQLVEQAVSSNIGFEELIRLHNRQHLMEMI
jgi:hypothetical protein